VGLGLKLGVTCVTDYGFFISGLQSLARELVSSRRVVDRLYANRAQLNSISMHLGESVGNFSHLVTFRFSVDEIVNL
jgi:hypothetical protein